ncbi:MAG TPA: response regulator [Burkholderiaceae bacterium]|nr:response regulator [Burkholderiaceae bacterium]
MKHETLQELHPHRYGTLLARLLAIADHAVVVVDEAQRIVVFNEGAERSFGYRSADMLGQQLALLLPEAARADHGRQMRGFADSAVASRRMADRRTIHGRRADGSLFAAEASISHVEFGGEVFYAAILRDVSEARRALHQLELSEARFRGLAADVPVGIFQTDAAGRCIYVNDRWCAMAGLSAAQAEGDGWVAALHAADRARVAAAWSAAVAERAVFDLRYRLVRPDRTETWVVGRAVAHLDAEGRLDGYLGTVTDITESHLHATAMERARAEAEETTRAKSMFLANMSHEIRTPLNAVVGLARLLGDTSLNAEQREWVAAIRGGAEELLQIVSDILDYSRTEAGKLEMAHEAFDLRRSIEQALDTVAPRALERRLNLAYLMEEGTPETLIGDELRVRQILLNLLSNAVKFTHRGEVFVSVASEALGGVRHRVHFSVHDTGIGIAAEHVHRLFQSFTQVDASTTRHYGGTGLGLAISRRLAELMGGTVGVRSEVGRGSVFRATVELEAGAAPALPDYMRGDPDALVGKRVLIVDEHQTNRRVVTQLALRWGMIPSTLPSAQEAIDRVRHGESYDVAVFDKEMKGIDGLALAVEFRRRRSDDELPIVMLCPLGRRPSPADGHGIGAAAYVFKPIKAGQLFAALTGTLPVGPSTLFVPHNGSDVQRELRGARRALRVLVAEDNTAGQLVAVQLLRRLGYQADVARDGLEAMQVASTDVYDVVLMDVQMPEVDGVQAARWIVRRRGSSPRPCVIAMTANALPGDRAAFLAAGMDGYVAKPVDIDQLATALEHAGQRLTDALAPAVQDDDGPLDVARLEHLVQMQDESQPHLVREMIDLYLAGAPGHIASIEGALDESDATRVASLAHRFLSLAGNVGARRMTALCEQIEHGARGGRLADIAPCVRRLQAENERAREAFEAARRHY